MTRIKVLGLALVAVFAMAAIASASASAAGPVWYECAKAAVKGTGTHTEKNCSDPAKETGGSYVLKIGVGKGKAFKSSGGAAVLHSINPEAKIDIPVECASFKGSGLAVPPNLVVKVSTTFSKCKALAAPCSNGKKETISTEVLAGQLGWINPLAKVPGTDLVSEAKPGGQLAAFTCEAIGEIRTSGSVIGMDEENVGKISKTSKLNFAPSTYIGPQHAGPCTKENEETKVCEKWAIEWTPIVNIPKFFGGPVDILMTEVKGKITGHPEEFYPPGGIPSGQEGVSNQKGEAIEIAEEGTV